MHEAGDLKVHVEGNLIRQCTDCEKLSSKDNPGNRVVINIVDVRGASGSVEHVFLNFFYL